MAKNKIEFTTTGRDGAEIKLKVKRPSAEDRSQAELVQAARTSEAVKHGVLLSAQVDKYVRENNLWTDEDEARFQELGEKIFENRKKLKRGGRDGLTKSDARRLALEVKAAIDERVEILSVRNSIADTTAESLGGQAAHNYLVARCTFWAEGDWEGDKRYYDSVEDFLDRADEKAAFDASKYLYELMYAKDDVVKVKSTEDEILHKYGFVNDDGQLIDKDGNLVDFDGNPIVQKGYEEEDVFVEFLDDADSE